MRHVFFALALLLTLSACQQWVEQLRPVSKTPGVPVNVFLWRGALQTLSFLPLSHTDPFGGVIITDWYAPNETERFKITVTILSQTLRSDGVAVNVVRETQKNGIWVSANSTAVAKTLTDIILTRAREQRIAAREAN